MLERFRHKLQQELMQRKQANSAYSARAFAQSLDVNHSTLLQMMRGARRIPARQIREWGRKLSLGEEEINVYVAAEGIPPACDIHRDFRLHQWSEEASALMATDSHWRILKLARKPAFRPDSRWISAQTGVPTDEVNVVFTRLLRLGLLTTSPTGRWNPHRELASADHRVFLQFALARLRERNTV